MKKREVLITGSNGFVARHLRARLEHKGYKVIGIERKHARKSFDNIKDVYYGDITKWNFVKKVFSENNIAICFHLASKSLVEHGKNTPLQTLESNITGTIHILEACRQYSVEKTILSSTSHVYGNNPNVPYKEYYIPRPSRIYETSKTCADIIAQSYIDTYKIQILIARFSNIYGPGDTNVGRIIPFVMRQVIDNTDPQIWGGDSVRDYIYIDDAIAAYMKLLKYNQPDIRNRIFNFGSKPISVAELVKKIIRASDHPTLQTHVVKGSREGEIKVQYVSWAKAKRLLKWQPRTSLERGLAKTYLWYKDYFFHEQT